MKNIKIKKKEEAKQATMSFLVEVIPRFKWIILHEKF